MTTNQMDREEADRRSFDPDVLADVETFGWRSFCDTDRSIAIHRTHDVQEAWNRWEWPRRLAALRTGGGAR